MAEQQDLKTRLTTGCVITVLGLAFLFAFGASIIHGLIDFLHWLGAK